jgi:hypothetical protein
MGSEHEDGQGHLEKGEGYLHRCRSAPLPEVGCSYVPERGRCRLRPQRARPLIFSPRIRGSRWSLVLRQGAVRTLQGISQDAASDPAHASVAEPAYRPKGAAFAVHTRPVMQLAAGRTPSAPWAGRQSNAMRGGRRFSRGSESTQARAAPAGRWSRASPAATRSPARRRAVCGCGRNDTCTGLRR